MGDGRDDSSRSLSFLALSRTNSALRFQQLVQMCSKLLVTLCQWKNTPAVIRSQPGFFVQLGLPLVNERISIEPAGGADA